MLNEGLREKVALFFDQLEILNEDISKNQIEFIDNAIHHLTLQMKNPMNMKRIYDYIDYIRSVNNPTNKNECNRYNWHMYTHNNYDGETIYTMNINSRGFDGDRFAYYVKDGIIFVFSLIGHP
jgi:glutamate synthase domain-containing protein 3